MTDPKPDPRLVKDVAREVERRRRRRKLLLLVVLAGAIVFAVLYGTCGHGWGLGAGAGAGAGEGSIRALVTTVDAAPKRCAIRVAAVGITVDGAVMTKDVAVAACKLTSGADVVVTGDAREGDWTALREALAAAHVETSVREPARPR
ncbi:MAG: hypothetical protein NT062_14545 [Proteobacteria bacterium]|nr:hypothetical protein [Pseudomonadota bacterium]